MRIFLILAFAAGLLHAQQQLEIHGTVVEPGIDHGIAGVEVSISQTIHPERSGAYQKSVAKLSTDAVGGFDLTPSDAGGYTVTIKKDGYLIDPRSGAIGFATLDSAHPKRELRLYLLRPGEAVGRVADENAKPLAGVHVSVTRIVYLHGKRQLNVGSTAVTDEDGRFRAERLLPGEYVASIQPRFGGQEKILTGFSEEVKSTDEDYEPSYWPGGVELDQVTPALLQSGGSADLGTLRPHKVPFYRLRVSLNAPPCKEGDRLRVLISPIPSSGPAAGQRQLPCGSSSFFVRGLAPGSYTMLAMQGDGEERVSAMARVELVDRDLEASLSLAHGLDIHGKMLVADGPLRLPFEKMDIHTRLLGGIETLQDFVQGPPNADGAFEISNAEGVPFELQLDGLDKNFYVEQMRYNGRTVSGKTIPVEPGAPTQTLEVFVHENPAVVNGQVMLDDKPVAGSYVVAIPWPASRESIYDTVVDATGDEDGKFHLAGLAPGEYRIFAIPALSREKLDEPNMLDRLAGSGEKVTVERGSLPALTLKLVDPGH